MGKAMRLNPAILLLSLSIWGALLGFIGLIIALPATTLLMAYYQRYITKENEENGEIETKKEKSSAHLDSGKSMQPVSLARIG